MPEAKAPSGPSLVRPIVIVAIVLTSSFALGTLQQHVDSVRDSADTYEMLYFPNEKLLRHFTAGLSTVVADMMWYQTVQYVGEEFQTRSIKTDWLARMIDTTTTLSPHYVEAYRYGGSLLAAIGADDLGMDVLRNGFKRNPESWEIPYEMHVIYLMNRRNDPGAKLIASRFAYLVGERHDSELGPIYIQLAKKLIESDEFHEEAVAFFSDRVARESDPMLKALAQEQLRTAIIERNVAELGKAADAYKDKFNSYPASLTALLEAGLVNELPTDPWEGRYYIDGASEQVRNLVIQEERKTHYLRRIVGLIQMYYAELGFYPKTLDDLWVWTGTVNYPYPLPDGDWQYDPFDGSVR